MGGGWISPVQWNRHLPWGRVKILGGDGHVMEMQCPNFYEGEPVRDIATYAIEKGGAHCRQSKS